MQSRSSTIFLLLLLTGALCLAVPLPVVAATNSSRGSVTLRAAVAANFREPFAALSELYGRVSGESVDGVFGSSGLLFAQIQQGAPFDLFFSADSERPRRLVESGHATGVPFTYAEGRLALWTPGRKANLTSGLADRFALANPELAPYGRAARECLQSMKLWQQVGERAVYGSNISQTYHFVASGGIPAGFIAYAQALAQNVPGSQLWLVPASCHEPIVQQVVALRSEFPQEVEQFLRFIASGEAQAIISARGYVHPGQP